MSGLQFFLAFMAGGLWGIGVMFLVMAARNPFVTLLTDEDIDRMWHSACMDVAGQSTVRTFARRIEEYVTP